MAATNHLKELEDRLWDAADELRANSGLKRPSTRLPCSASSSSVSPTSGSPRPEPQARRPIRPPQIVRRRLPGRGRPLPARRRPASDTCCSCPRATNIGKAINDAMRAIEEENAELAGVLPKTYKRLDNATLLSAAARLRLRSRHDLEGDAFGTHLRILPRRVRHAPRARRAASSSRRLASSG